MLPHPSVCVRRTDLCDRFRIIVLIFSLKYGFACGPEPQLQFKSAVPKLLLRRHIFGYKMIFSSPAVIQCSPINTLTCVCITGHHAKALKQTPRPARPPGPEQFLGSTLTSSSVGGVDSPCVSQFLLATYEDGRPTGLRLPRWCF